MKNIHLIFGFWLLILSPMYAQIEGNNNIKIETLSISAVDKLIVGIVADLSIIQSEEYYMRIETDENVFDLIGRDIIDGELTLDQKEWISPSSLKIEIGIPNLASITTTAHGTTNVVDFIQSILEVNCEVGTLVLTGEVDSIQIFNHVGTIDASGMIAQSGHVVVDSWGKVKAHIVGDVTTELDEDAGFSLVNKKHKYERIVELDPNLKFIDVKVKNNSWKRHNFYVKGPKPDGSSFSYGFALWPGQKKSKQWTVGSQVFKENGHGDLQLLVTIDAEDEGSIVKLWD